MLGLFILKTSEQKAQLSDELSDMVSCTWRERSFFSHGSPSPKNLKSQFHLFLHPNTYTNTQLQLKYEYKSHGFLLPTRLPSCKDRRGPNWFQSFKNNKNSALHVCKFYLSNVLPSSVPLFSQQSWRQVKMTQLSPFKGEGNREMKRWRDLASDQTVIPNNVFLCVASTIHSPQLPPKSSQVLPGSESRNTDVKECSPILRLHSITLTKPKDLN